MQYQCGQQLEIFRAQLHLLRKEQGPSFLKHRGVVCVVLLLSSWRASISTPFVASVYYPIIYVVDVQIIMMKRVIASMGIIEKALSFLYVQIQFLLDVGGAQWSYQAWARQTLRYMTKIVIVTLLQSQQLDANFVMALYNHILDLSVLAAQE